MVDRRAHMSRLRRSPRQLRRQELLTSGRVAADLTQHELATLLKRSQSFVSKYESGERRLNVIELIEVSDAIGVDPRQIVGDLAEMTED